MKSSQERATKKALKTSITILQSVDVLLNGVFARDSESAESDGFPEKSSGGASGKGDHSDRTGDHAMREDMSDPIHADVLEIVNAINTIRATAARIERKSRRLTAHERGVII